ncbi:hypothetical protein SELMODRAFT_425253 [Selaginella moellendorffii]|uniref:Transmembrane protein n=1 Tax=Selaginella moellendorffii TaxID=88036 RepID=D8SSH9_SELML|nr:hypothetical protein SELMODRAFT_425253 [Selaginella moellendorffii]
MAGRSSLLMNVAVALVILLVLVLEPNVASGNRLLPAKLVIRYHEDHSFGVEIPGLIKSEQATAFASPRRQTLEHNSPAESRPKFLEKTISPDDLEITAPAASPDHAGVVQNATVDAVVSHSPGEKIAIVVVIVFFVASIGALVLYVCKTKKYIEHRRAASLARSIEQGFGPRSIAQASTSSSLSPSSPGSYSPPHPQLSNS